MVSKTAILNNSDPNHEHCKQNTTQTKVTYQLSQPYDEEEEQRDHGEWR